LLNAGKEIVLVAHSYGGTPGCSATENHTIAERSARGEKGGIKAILFIASILVSKRGTTLAEALGPQDSGANPYMDIKVCDPNYSLELALIHLGTLGRVE
jgi:hypothetical protein